MQYPCVAPVLLVDIVAPRPLMTCPPVQEPSAESYMLHIRQHYLPRLDATSLVRDFNVRKVLRAAALALRRAAPKTRPAVQTGATVLGCGCVRWASWRCRVHSRCHRADALVTVQNIGDQRKQLHGEKHNVHGCQTRASRAANRARPAFGHRTCNDDASCRSGVRTPFWRELVALTSSRRSSRVK